MKTIGLFSDRVSSRNRDLNYRKFELGGAEVVGVKYSSINYKDRLLVGGAAYVSRHKSIVPGIDLVCSIGNSHFVSAGFDLGVNRNGGWAQHCHIPHGQLTHIPEGFSLEACAAYGTAGLTAAEIVRQVELHTRVNTSKSVLIVGGVRGSSFFTALFLLALGYRVTLISRHEAAVFADFEGFTNIELDKFLAPKPLSIMKDTSEYDVAIDFLGGDSLANSIGSLSEGGTLFSVGNVMGNRVEAFSLAPFFLRGICLQGVNLERLEASRKASLWQFIFENEYLWRQWVSWSMVKFSDLKDYLLEGPMINDRPRVVVNLEE